MWRALAELLLNYNSNSFGFLGWGKEYKGQRVTQLLTFCAFPPKHFLTQDSKTSCLSHPQPVGTKAVSSPLPPPPPPQTPLHQALISLQWHKTSSSRMGTTVPSSLQFLLPLPPRVPSSVPAGQQPGQDFLFVSPYPVLPSPPEAPQTLP